MRIGRTTKRSRFDVVAFWTAPAQRSDDGAFSRGGVFSSGLSGSLMREYHEARESKAVSRRACHHSPKKSERIFPQATTPEAGLIAMRAFARRAVFCPRVSK
jgi:hypothetical protein